MPSIKIEALQFDDHNESEMLVHGVTQREVMQVHEGGEYHLLRNVKRHAATHLMVGPTTGGRWLTIPVGPTGEPGVWRPATAFAARRGDLAKIKGEMD